MRRTLLAIVLMTLPLASPASGDAVGMISVTDLRQVASLAKRDNLIVVLEFASEYCGYCRRLEAQFLVPMQRNRDYDDKVLIRSVSLDNFATLVDFSGLPIAAGEFASRYDVSLTPTLVFLNAAGVEMSKKLVGIWSEDFYGGFIDNRIDEARRKLAPVATTVSVSE